MINVGKEKYEVDIMDGYTEWIDARKNVKDGMKVRLLLGYERVVDGVWLAGRIVVDEVSRSIRHRAKEGDVLEYNERTFGFLRHRPNYRDITILTRSWMLLVVEDETIDEVGEEE